MKCCQLSHSQHKILGDAQGEGWGALCFRNVLAGRNMPEGSDGTEVYVGHDGDLDAMAGLLDLSWHTPCALCLDCHHELQWHPLTDKRGSCDS